MKEPIVIYSEFDSARLNYAAGVLLGSLLEMPYKITTDVEQFNNSHSPKINYSQLVNSNAINIIPNGLLFETGIRQIEPGFANWKNTPVLFPNKDIGDLPFDIFAASFYLLTRYEEYLPFKADQHGRYSAELSVAYRNSFLEEPVVQQWSLLLLKAIQDKYHGIPSPKRKFTMEPTIDVDVAYAYRGRGIGRSVLASGRDFSSLKLKNLLDRMLVLTSTIQDPFDTYFYIDAIHKKYKLPTYMFFLSGDYSRYDRNIPVADTIIKQLLLQLSKTFQVGLHPSYRAFDSLEILKGELSRFASIVPTSITNSRQHFLRISFPKTYQWLIQLGITNDFSMGYHDKPGFRAGIAAPFKFYDLEKETTTNLTIHPFAYMERVLKDRLNMNPDKALLKIQSLMKKVKTVNGTFGSLWHNDSLSNYGEWRRWRYVYEVMLSMGYTMEGKHKIDKVIKVKL